MTLKPCRDCGNQISVLADICPRCGRLTDSELLRLIPSAILGLVILVLLLVFLCCGFGKFDHQIRSQDQFVFRSSVFSPPPQT